MRYQTSRARGRLNAFQKVMLQWSSLHPYNALHVYKIAGPVRSDDLRVAVARSFEQLGLGVAELLPDGQSYRHKVDRDPTIEVIKATDDTAETLRNYSARALNRPYGRPISKPFRFAAIDGGPQFHYVALVYDHWIADSVSARMLLREVLNDYLGFAPCGGQEAVEHYPGTYREVFRRRLCGPQSFLSVVRTLQHWNRNRSAWRVACWSNTEWTVDHRLYHTIPGTAARLREFARANGATVHDVFLAAFGRALAEVMPARGKKAGLALGSIVDTRGIADVDLGNTFGAFLGYYLVRTQPDRKLGLDEATRQVALRTGPIKAGHQYMDSLVNMQFINTLWPWLSETTRRHFMRKSLPMSGGISNVVVRDTWMNANRHVILDYHRGVSTGPSLPIVLTPTTFGDQLNIGVSYRIAGFSRAKIDAAMELMRDQLEHPNKASRGALSVRPAAVPPRDPFAIRAQQPVPHDSQAAHL
jgi:hypothetical protein